MLEDAFGKEVIDELVLISDGGSENTALNIKQFLLQIKRSTNSTIKHKIALKDIRYSNSMIERFFRTMKYDYPHLISNSTYKTVKKEHGTLNT